MKPTSKTFWSMLWLSVFVCTLLGKNNQYAVYVQWLLVAVGLWFSLDQAVSLEIATEKNKELQELVDAFEKDSIDSEEEFLYIVQFKLTNRWETVDIPDSFQSNFDYCCKVSEGLKKRRDVCEVRLLECLECDYENID